MLLLPTTKSDRSDRLRFHRLVSLSGLGWAFVLAAVLWELFALAFSQCAGWGWDKGAFFFAWGLGILAFGFYLRTSRKQPAVSRLFLGVNILVVSVLSLVVATR
jgi:MFS family permease